MNAPRGLGWGGCLVELVRISHSWKADGCVITLALTFAPYERRKTIATISLNTTKMMRNNRHGHRLNGEALSLAHSGVNDVLGWLCVGLFPGSCSCRSLFRDTTSFNSCFFPASFVRSEIVVTSIISATPFSFAHQLRLQECSLPGSEAGTKDRTDCVCLTIRTADYPPLLLQHFDLSFTLAPLSLMCSAQEHLRSNTIELIFGDTELAMAYLNTEWGKGSPSFVPP